MVSVFGEQIHERECNSSTTGAISFNAGGNLEGRLLTISGEITLDQHLLPCQ
jgi:hypothetical protein